MKIWFRKTIKKLFIVLIVLSAVFFLFFLGDNVYVKFFCGVSFSYDPPPDNKEYVTNFSIQYKGHSYWRFRSDDKVLYSTDSHHSAEPIVNVNYGYINTLFPWIFNRFKICSYDDDPEMKMFYSNYSVLGEDNNLYIREDIDVSLKVENVSYIEVKSIYDDSVLNIYEEPEEIQYWIDKLETQEEWELDITHSDDKDVCSVKAYFKEVPQLSCGTGIIATKDVPEVGFSKNAAVTQ